MKTSELTRESLEAFSRLNNFALMPSPRMTMDEYCEFVEEMLLHIPPDQIERQKQREKQIKVPFRMLG